jgi:WD40 repeat protein
MNRALRRLVAAEEETRREKRQRLQQILKQRIADAAVASSIGSGSATSTPAPTSVAETDAATQDKKPATANGHATDDEEEEVIEQQKLLASASAHWRCVEDSQQAVCSALNRRQTLLAIGEKDGRISIWDNTTVRVITKELDPTSIVLPVVTEAGDATTKEEEKQERDNGGDDEAPSAKRVKTARGDQQEGDDQDGSADGDSATNEEVSVDGHEDGSVEADEEEDMGGAAMDVDEIGSVEDTVSVDETAVDEDLGDGDEEEVDVDGPGGSLDVASDETQPATQSRKLSDGGGLSFEELKTVKGMLKHVVSLAWSCDSSLVFAGCEEKSTRRGRLCVWDAESAWLLATFSFDGAVNALSAHPTNPYLVVVCSYSALPVLLNVRSREMIELAVPIVNSTLTVTPPPNSRHPSLVVNCRYGMSGRFLYCATSKSTVAILDSISLACLDVRYLSVLIQFVDLAVNPQETALAFTSSKGIHEFAIQGVVDTKPSLQEVRLHATGAVRAPWALCCFSSDGGYVVGMPIVRHRHVGESGLYTWHRGTGRVQHNLGVKDGVNSISWDVRRDAILVVSCAGAIHVLEETFTTEWPGTMYPAGFRLVTDNEMDMEAIERELEEGQVDSTSQEMAESRSSNGEPEFGRAVDVFSMRKDEDEYETLLPSVENERLYIPSIPIPQNVKRHHQHDFHIERHFGLGQSVFEPLKSAIKKPSSSSLSKKSKKSAPSGTVTTVSSKSKSKSKSIFSSKKRRR